MVADERWYFMKEKLQRFMWGRYGNDLQIFQSLLREVSSECYLHYGMPKGKKQLTKYKLFF